MSNSIHANSHDHGDRGTELQRAHEAAVSVVDMLGFLQETADVLSRTCLDRIELSPYWFAGLHAVLQGVSSKAIDAEEALYKLQRAATRP
jgi:hypothetical protein